MSVMKNEEIEVGDDSYDAAGILATTASILECEPEEVPDRVVDLLEANRASIDFIEDFETFRG